LRAGLAALLVSAWPLAASADAGHIERLNGSQVAYRLQGVALVKDSKGKVSEASLSDAPMSAGDRVRYLIVATNQAGSAQVAGVAVTIPEFTVWEPPGEVDEADILEWTLDGKHWRAGLPKDPAKVHAIRWVLADVLMPHMSAAFAFSLRLTGPYSDRTGDLNATRSANVRPLIALENAQIASIQTVHPERAIAKGPGLTDPLGLGAMLSNTKSLVDYNGLKMAELTTRNDVAYRATGTAFIRGANGSMKSVPVAQARLGVGDRVTYAFLAQNIGDATRAAGATFVIPSYARFNSAATRGDGIIEVTDDFVHWHKPSKFPPEKVRGIRWAYDGKLNVRESAAFQVMVDVIGAPKAEDLQSKDGQGTFQALSPSAIQSVKFTNELTASAANASKDIANQIANIGSSFEGVPLNSSLAEAVNQVVQPGIVKSDATPIPTPEPLQAKSAGAPPEVGLIGMFIGGGLFILVFFIFSQMRGGTGGDPSSGGSGGGFSMGGDGGGGSGGSSELAGDGTARARGAGSLVDDLTGRARRT
jgi:uncharacterized membrane protein YgcG